MPITRWTIIEEIVVIRLLPIVRVFLGVVSTTNEIATEIPQTIPLFSLVVLPTSITLLRVTDILGTPISVQTGRPIETSLTPFTDVGIIGSDTPMETPSPSPRELTLTPILISLVTLLTFSLSERRAVRTCRSTLVWSSSTS